MENRQLVLPRTSLFSAEEFFYLKLMLRTFKIARRGFTSSFWMQQATIMACVPLVASYEHCDKPLGSIESGMCCDY
jgi:hypothetical protein